VKESKRIGDVLFIQGMTGRDNEGKLVSGIEAQARRAFERIAHTLNENGLDLDAVGRARVYLTDADDWRRCVADIVGDVFGPDGPPVTLIGVARLGDPAALIEIEADVVAP
jgi:enamine deaminase RidA (YjgF/YER057c/UK114 family)